MTADVAGNAPVLATSVETTAGRGIFSFRDMSLQARIGAGMVVTVVALCVVMPIVLAGNPTALSSAPLLPPSSAHPFGTDTLGRDVFVRVFYAGRVDLAIASVGVAVPMVIGTLIGTMVAASTKRGIDTAMMRVTDGVIAFPFVILTLLIVLTVGPGASVPPFPPGGISVVIAIFLVDWPIYARLARSRTLVLRDEEFIAAARLLGYSPFRIVRRHLLPSVWSTVLAYAVADLLLVIALTAALPFVGAGIQPPNAEWGSMMYEGRGVLAQAWWVALIPAGFVVFVGVGVMLTVDASLSRGWRPRIP